MPMLFEKTYPLFKMLVHSMARPVSNAKTGLGLKSKRPPRPELPRYPEPYECCGSGFVKKLRRMHIHDLRPNL